MHVFRRNNIIYDVYYTFVKNIYPTTQVRKAYDNFSFPTFLCFCQSSNIVLVFASTLNCCCIRVGVGFLPLRVLIES